MTEMPQLVAAMHSLVGLAAVFVGYNAHFQVLNVAEVMAVSDASKEVLYTGLGGFAKLIAKKTPAELSILHVELFLGVFIGAITFTGSVVAYGKLAGKVTSAATKLPGGHAAERGCAAGLSLICLIWYTSTRRQLDAVPDDSGGAVHRLSPDHGHRRRGYAGGCVHAEQLLGLGGGGDRLLARQRPADRGWRAGGLVGCNPVLHHV